MTCGVQARHVAGAGFINRAQDPPVASRWGSATANADSAASLQAGAPGFATSDSPACLTSAGDEKEGARRSHLPQGPRALNSQMGQVWNPHGVYAIRTLDEAARLKRSWATTSPGTRAIIDGPVMDSHVHDSPLALDEIHDG